MRESEKVSQSRVISERQSWDPKPHGSDSKKSSFFPSHEAASQSRQSHASLMAGACRGDAEQSSLTNFSGTWEFVKPAHIKVHAVVTFGHA